MPILVTGAAGFIGAYACRALRARGETVVGLDNHNDYYDPRLKRDRVAALCPEVDIRVLDRQGTHELFAAKRTYHSQIADAVVPEKPLTVGPGYHLNPEAEENQGG